MTEYSVSDSIHRLLFKVVILLDVIFLSIQFLNWTVPRSRSYVGMIGIAIILTAVYWFRRLMLYAFRFDAAFKERQEQEINDKLEIERIDQMLGRPDKELMKARDVVIVLTDGERYVPVRSFQIPLSEVRKILAQARGDVLQRQALREWPKEPKWITLWRKVL